MDLWGLPASARKRRWGLVRSLGLNLLFSTCFGFTRCYWYNYQMFCCVITLNSLTLLAYLYVYSAFWWDLHPTLRVAQDKPSDIVVPTVFMYWWIFRLSSVPPHLLYYCCCVIIMWPWKINCFDLIWFDLIYTFLSISNANSFFKQLC